MDNNELDKFLKENLKGKIEPSKEFEAKIKEKIEYEKRNANMKANSNQQNHNKRKTKRKMYKRMSAILSMVAVFAIVFTVGIMMSTNMITGETTTATITAIEPTKLKSGILASDSEFLIHAKGEDINEESVAQSLYVDPPLDYTITKTNKEGEYKLSFKQNIPDNTIVKLQYIKDKITENSWAYQTSNNLSVNRTYPENKSTSVSKNTVIEVELSYVDTDNIENYFQISPEVKGRWEHIGKVWRFIPNTELDNAQKYIVTIKNGLKAKDQVLENDYKFEFVVNEFNSIGAKYTPIRLTIDGIFTYKSNEAVKIYYNKYTDEDEPNEISKMDITKLNNIEEFKEYLITGIYNKEGNKREAEFDLTKKYLQMKNTLPNGYYIASIKDENGRELFNCPIQINELSAYAIETGKDIITWVAEGENLAKDITVKYNEKEQKTNNDGIVKFENGIDGSDSVKYLTIGNNENKLVVGIHNYVLDGCPYAYLYTDRPLYKNTDTIKVWGFVPVSQFYGKVEDQFYIQLNGEEKQKVKVNEDGILNYEINLKNHVDTSYTGLCLYYKDTQIGFRSVEIKNYEAQNYNYEIILNKNYGYEDEEFEFDVKATHITGLSVPNKDIKIEFEDRIYIEKTGDDGKAHFKIKLPKRDYDYSGYVMGRDIRVYNGEYEEYNTDYEYKDICILSRNTYTSIKEENGIYSATLYKLDTNRKTNVGYELKELYDGKYNTEVTVEVEETVWQRYISGYHYDEYTKQNEPEYSYNKTENVTTLKKINTQDGRIEVNKNEINMKKANEEENYEYSLIYVYKDADGKEVKERQYVYFEYNVGELGFSYLGEWDEYSNDSIYELQSQIDIDRYYTYRYLLKKDSTKFSIGSTKNFKLAESKASGIEEIANEGKLLEIVFKESISKAEIVEGNEFSYQFTEKDFPGCKLTSAYFVNGKFYRMPVYYLDFNEDDRKVDIEITADKEKYQPGDTVKLKIKTTNKGTPVKTYVNVSVANEAVFKIEEDFTDLLSTIYENKPYPVYTYSTYIDELDKPTGGAGGGAGEPRGDFGDTAHFETLETNSNGEATVTFKLPDNVTTYRVTVHSVNKDLYAGVNTTDITSTLDFFIQSTEPRGIKTSDDLVLNATSVANEIYDVDFEFTIKELNKTLNASAKTNSIATVNFGKLKFGTYHAVISGSHGNYKDSIEYEFKVVESTQEVNAKTTMSINSKAEIKPNRTPVVLEIYNKNTQKYLEYINFIEMTKTERLDTKIAYDQIQKVKDKYYGTETPASKLDIDNYGEGVYYKNLINGNEDIVLTALVNYYAKEYGKHYTLEIDEQINNENIFEVYLLAAANNEPVLLDLLYLKDEKDISNYGKLLVTLSLEFLGDYQNAKDLYNSIQLNQNEQKQYASIIAIIETFINKDNVTNKIDLLIKNSPADEYLRFAILSLFENKSSEIEKEENVKIISNNSTENITINGLKVSSYTVYDEDLSTIKFETNSEDLVVSYSYQCLLDDINGANISKDITISIDGEIKKGNTVNLIVNFDSQYAGEVRIALPNSLRLAQNYNNIHYYHKDYFLERNQIDYVTFFKNKDCYSMTIPLIVNLDGDYKFENVVCVENGKYHISNSIDL